MADGHAPPDVPCNLHHCLLTVGDVEGARQLADELRQGRPSDGDVYVLIGENYQLIELLRMGERVELGDDLAAARDAAGLVRVRRALDLPFDEYDGVVKVARSDD